MKLLKFQSTRPPASKDAQIGYHVRALAALLHDARTTAQGPPLEGLTPDEDVIVVALLAKGITATVVRKLQGGGK